MSDLPIAKRLTRASPYRRNNPSAAQDSAPPAKESNKPGTLGRKSNAGRTPRKTPARKTKQSATTKKVTFSPDQPEEADDDEAREPTPTPSHRTGNVTPPSTQDSEETTSPRSAMSARLSSSPTASHPVTPPRGMHQTPTLRSTPDRSSPSTPSSFGSVRTPPLNRSPRTPSTARTPKRPAEDDNASPSPKRQRSSNHFRPPSSESDQSTSVNYERQPEQPGDQSRTYLTTHDADKILDEVALNPRELKLDEITAVFCRLQERSFNFALQYFSFHLSAEEQAAWPMHALGDKYRSLFLITQYLADASHCGWRDFFTKPEHRQSLIHAILGEWFKQRIFKIPGFGLPETASDPLAAVDHEYMHYDGIVRNKKRAEYLKLSPWKLDGTPNTYAESVEIASIELARELMLQISPLAPQGSDVRKQLLQSLVELIKLMTGVSTSIRMAGINGTTLRFAPHVPKGTELCEDQRDVYICVNAPYCQMTRPAKGPRRLEIRMTCWGRLEAVKPRGPDRLDLENFQQNKQKELPEGKEFRWEDYEDQVFPVLPADQQKSHEAAATAAAVAPQPDGTEWGRQLAEWTATGVKNHKYPNFDTDIYGIDAPKPERGSFVTYYPRVAPPNVYCAWAPAKRPTTQFPDLGDADQPKHETLAEAVDAARRAQGLHTLIHDVGIQSINTIRYYRPLEWIAALFLGAGALAATHQHGIIPSASDISTLAVQAKHSLGQSVSEAQRHASCLALWMRQAGNKGVNAIEQMAASAASALIPAAATASTHTLTATVTGWTTTTVPAPLSATPMILADLVGAENIDGVHPMYAESVSPDDPDYKWIQERLIRDLEVVQARAMGNAV
ncbi:hypothetical protein LTR10_014855 [Elasticomyces elasticus]|uniref:Uncharacterized protein n=1 Tax=Exophiala sideris TaxID=1016849 RepID=A0ABR0JFV2_9EURO|nr:hypothetical protein LTR10_014855 [Elasticomyces elasticus]KAK5025698.1 hypothetical protein LTS07_007902 [Exophiala sideris]KAK5033093.1 hypothetical protein LTR13_007058 [Exophiala sideris]KAK5063578.1 hypothetical protein LTR69_004284 [Exophiala sideris]KAK5180589.1 hypothetical protein LTR44_006903 [Eurotiomycetes sp. CCFEE 6388]